MTLHEFFRFTTLGDRCLVFAYSAVFLLQGGYLARVIINSSRLSRSSRQS